MTDHVLVPIDESERAEEALEFALSAYPDARLTAVHVLDPVDAGGATGLEAGDPGSYDEVWTERREAADRLLEAAADRARERGVSLETERLVGSVSNAIVDFADERDVDHIVVGSHGRTGASRVLLGSVAEKVARRAPVPVTIVR